MKDNDYDLEENRYLPKKISLRIVAWKVQDIRDLLEEIDKPGWEEKIKCRL